jgi:hypothetical protein
MDVGYFSALGLASCCWLCALGAYMYCIGGGQYTHVLSFARRPPHTRTLTHQRYSYSYSYSYDYYYYYYYYYYLKVLLQLCTPLAPCLCPLFVQCMFVIIIRAAAAPAYY